MATCEHCGTHITEEASVCPACGAPLLSQAVHEQSEGSSPGNQLDNQPNRLTTPGFEAYTPEIRAPSDRVYIPRAASRVKENQEGQPSPLDTSTVYSEEDSVYQRTSFRLRTSSVRVLNMTISGPEIVEALLSLFLGIYGVGWLLAGELPVGILLLIGSVVIYLPLAVVSLILAIATFGLSLLVTGPLAIGAICLNIYFLH